MDDETDVTGPGRFPEVPRVLDPAEEQLAGALQGALGGARHRPGLLARVQRRAELRRARQRMAAGTTLAGLALVAAVGVPSVLQPDERAASSASAPAFGDRDSGGGGGGAGEAESSASDARESAPAPSDDPAPPSGTAPPPLVDQPLAPPASEPAVAAEALPPLSAASLLSVDQLTGLHPDISEIEPPATAFSSSAPAGGYCGLTVLEGVAVPSSSWRAAWVTPDHVFPGADVGERVLRWESAADAASFVAATRASSTECGADGPSTDERSLQVLVSRGGEGGGRPTALAVAPPSDAGSLWWIRATASAGRTAVDLTVYLDSPDAASAGRTGSQLLDIALARAVRDDPSAS